MRRIEGNYYMGDGGNWYRLDSNGKLVRFHIGCRVFRKCYQAHVTNHGIASIPVDYRVYW